MSTETQEEHKTDEVQTWGISTTEIPAVQTPSEETPADVIQTTETPAVEEAPVTEVVQTEVTPTVELNDEVVLNFLKEKVGIDATTFDDLKPKPQKEYSADVLKFAEFQEKTGRGLADFMEMQRDFTQEAPEANIKRVMRMENPALEQGDIDRLFERKFGINGLDEEDDAEIIADRLLDRKVELQRALGVLEKAKSEYELPRGSDEYIPEAYRNAKAIVDNLATQEEANKSLRDDFVKVTDSFFDNGFEGFKITVAGQETVFKPEDVKSTKATLSDFANFDGQFFDKSGKLINASGYYKALYAGMNADKLAQHYYDLGQAAYAEKQDRESKNIPPDGKHHQHANPSAEGWVVKKG